MTDMDTDTALDFALSLLPEAGAIALAHFRQPLAVQNKLDDGRYDPVTEADRGVESFLRERIHARFPAHGIVGEEHGTQEGSAALSWIIDPIDGTRAFISGLPAWGILVGLREHGRPVAGLMHQPYLEETFSGADGEAWLERRGERRRLHTRQGSRMADAVLYCTHPTMFESAQDLAAFRRIEARVRLARFGGDCYAYCLLALGYVDLVIEGGLKAYDIQPLIPIIEAAGGVVSGARGEDPREGGFVVAAANAALHAEVLAALAGHD